MPLVFVHGVANRPGPEQAAETAQRDALFRAITFRNDGTTILNPDWGSHAVSFASDKKWLPDGTKIQAFGGGGAAVSGELGLGQIAKFDGPQAVDLVVLGALEQAIVDAGQSGKQAEGARKDVIELAVAAADYIAHGLSDLDEAPLGNDALIAPTDDAFAQALNAEISPLLRKDVQAYSILDKIGAAVDALKGWAGNGISDAALRLKRREMSAGVALFLGDIFVYLRQREIAGPTGTRNRIFAPIIADLIQAANAPRELREPFVVIGHSLGGVLLYDILTDATCLAEIEAAAPGFRIDLWLSVGSQPGLFADLGLYPNKPKASNGLLPRPACVAAWYNVYDFTDVFSFLAAPFFSNVVDYGYDTKIDLVQAHSAYFQKPSFYKRLEIRLKTLGHL